MALNFDLNEITFEHEEYSFLKIGKEADSKEFTVKDFQNCKYKKINQLWGTLGWANDKHLSATGSLKCSKNGNRRHKGVTAEIAELLTAQNVEIDKTSDIKERFIDLSDIEFHNVPKDISNEEDIQLRFDLFLEKEEGALVYLQENPADDMHSKDAEIILITPESTDKNFSQNRYSLSYRFTYTFDKELNYKNEKVYLTEKSTKDKNPTKFVLKVLTFIRNEGDIKRYTVKSSKNLNKFGAGLAHKGLNKVGEKKYGLCKFISSATGGSFEDISASKIDSEKKTLLLIHGTFSTVDGSFSELLEPLYAVNGTKISFMQRLIDNGTFEQVIAFNHPTASHSVDENVTWLLDLLGETSFKHPIDIITTSRGALVAEVLTAHKEAFGKFRINKVLTFAPAHGSDLLKVAKGLDRFLSLMKKATSKTGWGYVLAIAQFSINAIRTQPGLEVMMPDSPTLKKILILNPIKVVYFKAMVGDYDGVLVDKWIKRKLANGLDKLLWLAFKSENDWVIGAPEQRKQLNGSNARYHSNFEYKCIHGKQFDPNHPKKNGQPANVRDVMFNFFNS